MDRKHATRRTSWKPHTRLGGQIAFRGQVFESQEALEAALTEAVVEAGWRVTPAGAASLLGYTEARKKVA